MEDTDWRPSHCPRCGKLRAAAKHPKCACDPTPPHRRSPLEHADPLVERVLYGLAKESARLREKLDEVEAARAAETAALRAKLGEAMEAFALIDSISVHSGGEIHGVTAMHWQQAMELAQRTASDALARITGGEG